MRRMRTLGGVGLAVALALGLLVAHPATASQTLVATTTVNVRSGPGIDQTIIGYVAWGHTVEATGDPVDGWTRIDYNGRTAYVSSQYFVAPGAQQAYDGPKGEAWTTAALNVRNGPSTSHARLDTLPVGAKVTLTGRQSNGFSQIVWYAGERAWVATTWLDGRGAAPAPTDPPVVEPSLPPVTDPEPPAAPEPTTPPATTDPAPPVAPDPSEPAADPGPTTPVDPEPTDPAPTDPAPTDPAPTAQPDPSVAPEPSPTAPPTEPAPSVAPTPEPTDGAEDPDGEPETPELPPVIDQKRAAADLNLRDRASLDGKIIAVIPSGSTLDVTGAEVNERLPVLWQGQVGWVASAYVTDLTVTGPTPPAAPVAQGVRYTTDSLNVRTGPSTATSIVGTLVRGQKVDITGTTSGVWFEIVYQGAARWVSGDYLSETEPPPPPAASSRAQAVVDFAKSKVGLAYIWGGNGPLGYDCSGLTKAAYASVGVSIPRVADQQATVGVPVSPADVQPGDLVFYYSPISHVAVYVGDGQVVHASTYGVGVIYSKVDMTPITAIRRLL